MVTGQWSHSAAWFHPHSYTNAPSKLVGVLWLVTGAESDNRGVVFFRVVFIRLSRN